MDSDFNGPNGIKPIVSGKNEPPLGWNNKYTRGTLHR
jgi:hypothetical protein